MPTMYPKDFGPRFQLDDPEVRRIADQVLAETKLGILKGVAHEIDRDAYPLGDEADSVEGITARYLKTRPREKKVDALNSVKAILEQPALYRENVFGPLSRVDLHSRKPVGLQVKELKLDRGLQVDLPHLRKLEIKENRLIRRALPLHVGNALEPAIPVVEIGPGPWIFFVDAIQKKYNELGGASGFLGDEVGGRGNCPDGKGRYQHYQHGSIYWSPDTGAHEVHGAIREKWKSLGWETGFLGYPLTDESTTPDGDGRYNHFQGGSVYWTSATGAHEVHGAIRSRWAAMGWEKSYLGYPLTDETETPDTIGRFTHFQGGSIYWTPNTGAHAVHENIRDKWQSLGWELGHLGYPIEDTIIYMHPSSMRCRFQGGEVTWSASTGAADVMPFKKLRLRIHKVKCLDETNPEWPGGDEINLGGVACSLNNGAATKIPAYRVSSDFDDGEQVTYNPPREFHTFNLQDIPGWPKHFTMTFALAEVDSGGFNDFLRDLLKQIRDKVISYIKGKAAALTGAALGAYIGLAAGIVGSIVGLVVGWLLGELFDWLIGLFNDDIFPTWSAALALPSVWHKWGAYTDSPQYSFWTRAHGGKYEVHFDWMLLP